MIGVPTNAECSDGVPLSHRSPRTPRLLGALVVSCCIAFLASACGGSDGSAESAQGAAPTQGGSGSGEFPVEIEHTYGSTTIETVPERIVTVGLTDQDPVLALGVAPVGVTEWFGDHPHAVWPWATGALDEAVGTGDGPEVLSTADTINFEAIAAQRPDVILAIYSGITQSDYDKLSQIAPTVAQPGEYVDYGVPWQEQAITVGRVLAQEERAEQLVADAEATLDRARADHPEFEGATGLVASPYSKDKIAIFGSEDVRGRFMSSLGFTQPPEVDELAGDQFSADIGQERIDLLDADVLVVLLADLDENLPVLEQQSLYTNLAVHQEGRGVYIDTYSPVGGATSFVTVLSVPFLVDEIVPKLAAAIDGDPSTGA